MRPSRSATALTVLILIALGLRVGYCAVRGTLGRSPQRGYREYVMAGQRLLEHGTLVSPLIVSDVDRTPSALLPPLYPSLVATAYGLFGVESAAATVVLQFVNAAATALTVLVVFLMARSLGGPRAAWTAGIIATVNPTLIGFTDLIWETSLFSLGVAVSVWLALRLSIAVPTPRPGTPPPFQEEGRGEGRKAALTPHPTLSPQGERGSSMGRGAWSWLAFGLWLGALALLNPALTIAYPFLVLWPLCRSKPAHVRSVLRGAGMTVLGWLVAITPWTVRNYIHFGELFYIRNGLPLELWIGACPEADVRGEAVYSNQFPLNNDDVQREVAAIGERAFLQDRGERARAAIAAAPWRYARLVAVRAMDYWSGSIFTHTTSDAGLAPRSAWRAGVMYFLMVEGVAVVLALVLVRVAPETPSPCPLPQGGRGVVGCTLVSRRLGHDLPWLIAIVVSFSLVYCLTHIQIRFRAPTEPLLAVIVGVLAVQAVAGRARSRHSSAGAGGSDQSEQHEG